MVSEFVLSQTQTTLQDHFLQASKTYTNSSIAQSKPIQKNIISALKKSWILQHSLPLKTAQVKMFGAIHHHLKQYLIQNFSTHSRREGTITMIVLQWTELHFLSNNYLSMSNTVIIGNVISFLCPVVSHFSWSAVKFMLKTKKSQHFSL